MIKKNLGLSLIAASALVMGCSSSSSTDSAAVAVTPAATVTYPATITDPTTLETIAALANTAGLTSLATAVQNDASATSAAALADATGVFTVFGPSNDAFTAANEAWTAATPEQRIEILDYHVVAGAVDAAMVAANVGNTLETLQGDLLTITEVDGALFVGGAAISLTDQYASNGIVHVIDSVLVPADVAAALAGSGGGTAGSIEAALETDHSIFLAAFQASSFGPNLENGVDWTFFAPTDAALTAAGLVAADLTQAVIEQHIHADAALADAGFVDGQTLSNYTGDPANVTPSALTIANDGTTITLTDGTTVVTVTELVAGVPGAGGSPSVYSTDAVVPR